MQTAIFSTKPYDRQFLSAANGQPPRHEFVFFEPRLSEQTAPLAAGFAAVCPFVNDRVDAAVLKILAAGGTRLIALRSAGFNHVDLTAAEQLGIVVARVPAYSPHAVAEFTVGLVLALNRKLPRAYARVREGNFSLDGLLGFDLFGRVAGIVGTGKIGQAVASILHGFGCRLLAHDVMPNAQVEELGAAYVPLDQLLRESDVITLHCPLTPETRYLIGERALRLVKPDVMLINTSRGALVDTQAVIQALKERRIGCLGLDVYEEEGDLFFEDLSSELIQDDTFMRLLTFPNVLVTGHQAFFTREALQAIAEQTVANISDFEAGKPLATLVTVDRVRP